MLNPTIDRTAAHSFMRESTSLIVNIRYRKLLNAPENTGLSLLVSSSHILEMIRVFGQPLTYLKNSDGKRLSVWILEDGTDHYVVYMNQGFGCSIEKVNLGWSKEEGERAFEFVKQVFTQQLSLTPRVVTT